MKHYTCSYSVFSIFFFELTASLCEFKLKDTTLKKTNNENLTFLLHNIPPVLLIILYYPTLTS